MGGGQEQEFEWDAGKAEVNLRKHGIAFEAASRIFKDDLPLSGQMRICLTMKSGLQLQAWSTADC
jgi:hypothetical protein